MADLVLVLHWLYVLLNVGPVPFILAGRLRHRGWRRTHVIVAILPALFPLLGTLCPLTILEARLRGSGPPQGFLARHLHDWLFIDAPSWVFAAGYACFALLVIGLYVKDFRKGRPA